MYFVDIADYNAPLESDSDVETSSQLDESDTGTNEFDYFFNSETFARFQHVILKKGKPGLTIIYPPIEDQHLTGKSFATWQTEAEFYKSLPNFDSVSIEGQPSLVK